MTLSKFTASARETPWSFCRWIQMSLDVSYAKAQGALRSTRDFWPAADPGDGALGRH